MKRKGIFITFEGPEGSGKSTQSRLLAGYLRKKGYRVVLTREPGGTDIGSEIRKIILDPGNRKLSRMTELFLYFADRAQHVSELILPALEEDGIVISDRFSDATMAYQGYGRSLDLGMLETMNGFATAGLKPDVTFLLDIEPQKGLHKARNRTKEFKARRGKGDRMERQSLNFHERVAEGYRISALKDRRFFRIHQDTHIRGIHEKIVGELKRRRIIR